MTCRRCHRVLKNRTSVDRGYGASCWKKLKKEEKDKGQILLFTGKEK
jgi:Family of unknown function (DUF6011)